MANKDLIVAKEGKLQFGNHNLSEKAKAEGFEFMGNIYKVKTFSELTKLERDDLLVYESEPGTTVSDFEQLNNGVSFVVSGAEDAMITVGLEEDTEYEVFENEKSVGKMKTNLGGKLSISVSLENAEAVAIKVIK